MTDSQLPACKEFLMAVTTTTTVADTSDVADTVNHLIQICRDGEHGFETAAKSVENNQTLQSELMQYSVQRHEFAEELQSALIQLGEQPADKGSIAGSLHRGWINLKQAVTSHDALAVLAECERGEDAAVEAYREATMSLLPAPVAGVVHSQYQSVMRVHDRIKMLRDTTKSA
jgi:uncharacterized protein (TIGR02284 family)